MNVTCPRAVRTTLAALACAAPLALSGAGAAAAATTAHPQLTCTATEPPGFTASGTLTLASGEVLCDSGTLTNQGTVTVAAGGSATLQVAQLVNHGTVEAPASSTLMLADAPHNLHGTTLTGGRWVAVGTLVWPGEVATLSASVLLSGSGTVEDSSSSDANAFATLARITSGGTFELDDSAYLQTGSVTSDGTIAVGTVGDSGDSVNWQDSGTFTMTGGSFTFLDPNACINVGSRAFDVTGGTIAGYGMLTGTTTVSGTGVMSPTLDGAPAAFWLSGTYDQTGGTFQDDVSGSGGTVSAGTFGVSGAVSLGGVLAVTSSGSRPASGTSYPVVTGSSVSGAFSAVHNTGVAGFTPNVAAGSASIVTMADAPPTAPGIGHAALSSTGATSLRWTPPSSDGGAAVNGYVVQPHPACACSGLSVGAGVTSTTIAGLTAGTRYTFVVHATNAVGTGVASAASNGVTPKATQGFWLAAADGSVFGAGDAAPSGGVAAPATDPVVGIAASASGGYYLVQRDGDVTAHGGARFFGSLLSLHVTASDVVAIAPTFDGRGYWLIGTDGGEFAFGDARFHGSLPGLGVRVDDVVGMVATPSGSGYLLVGADGGVFAFGARFHGSLPALGVHVGDVVGILPTGGEAGYVLVGADGGAFVFGNGAGYRGSLPGEGIAVSDVVGLALTADAGGYWMAGADGSVYAFGDAQRIATPAGVADHEPIAGIATAP